MPTRHDLRRGRRASMLLLASALVLLSWCASGAAQAATAQPPVVVSSVAMHGPTGDGDTHVASVDHGPRSGAVQVHHVTPDAVAAPVAAPDAPREVQVARAVDQRGPPVPAEPRASGSRAPPV